ncbi:MAG: M61 family metallopeptidase [Myxococcales bacterium]
MRCAAIVLLLTTSYPPGLFAQGAPSPGRGEMSLQVDLREAPRRIFHSRLRLAAKPGTMALRYPKWIPGEHGPNGPIGDVAGLVFTASGKRLRWHRDPDEMYRILVEVPQGVTELEAQLDLISPPPETRGFSGGASASAHIAVLSWNQVLLEPEGAAPAQLRVAASVRLPARWKFATPLRTASGSGAEVSFAPVSLEELVDSPVLAGEFLQEIPIGPAGGAPHFIEAAAESADLLHVDPQLKSQWDALVAQAQLLFGAHHYRSYRFLLTLSDDVAHFGLEHHESSDDRVPERALLDPDLRLSRLAGLLPHEFTHSWNGKFRRPAGLATGDYQKPMRGDLLWVYEGLTNYLGNVLSARSGLFTPDQARGSFAFSADMMTAHRGRTWRPLADTATAAQILYGARDDWDSWRRDVDFYLEGDLLWLEVDATIRETTKGARSLDDFCRTFFGGKSDMPAVEPYTLDDLIAALSHVAQLDWAGFFRKRVYDVAPDAPVAGIERSGWKVVYGPEEPEFHRSYEKARKLVDLKSSAGIVVDEDRMAILDVVPGSAADKAGVPPGTRLAAINGRKANGDRLRTAVAETARGGKLEFLVENAESYTTHSLDYRGGLRYARLERDESHPDLLTPIFTARR